MKKLLILIAVCGVTTMLSCSKEDVASLSEPEATTKMPGGQMPGGQWHLLKLTR